MLDSGEYVLDLGEPTICDMNCYFAPNHAGPCQHDPARREWLRLRNPPLPKEKLDKMITVYLAGNMDGLTTEEMTGWRNDFKARCIDGSITWLDPCTRNYSPREWRRLVEDDLADVRAADCIVARMTAPGIGTAMELVNARYAGIPVITVVPDFKKVSPWLRYFSDYVVEDFDHAYKILTAGMW